MLLAEKTVATREKIGVGKLNIPVALGITSVHLLAIFGIFYVSWSAIIIGAILFWLTGSLGIGVGYHRLLTHSSFQTYRWFKYLLTGIGALAWQGGPIKWVGNHRLHHKYADAQGDPHSPREGFWHAHCGWLFWPPDGEDPKEAAKDLMRDKGLLIIERLFWLPQLLASVVLFLGGLWYEDLDAAIAWLAWGVGVRTTLAFHFTWFVNSAAHKRGYRSFETEDDSTNLWWLWLLSWGEGWHNNHHFDQRRARHGIRWWEIDINFYTIKLFSWLGLAYNIVGPKPIKASSQVA